VYILYINQYIIPHLVCQQGNLSPLTYPQSDQCTNGPRIIGRVAVPFKGWGPCWPVNRRTANLYHYHQFMSRALVINPWVCDFKLYDEWMHPLGLYFLISLLRRNGWEVDFVNCLSRGPDTRDKRFSTGDFASFELPKPAPYRAVPRRYKRYGIGEGRLEALVGESARPDIVLVGSAMTYWIQGLEQTVETVRRVVPGVPVVVGGIAATLMPEVLERRMPAVLVHSGGPADACSALGGLHPLLSGLTVRGWRPDMRDAFALCEPHRHGPVLLSLGCPFRCSYCASRFLQPTFRLRSPELAADEVSLLAERFGVRDFAFYDDALLYRAADGLLPFLRRLAVGRRGARFHVPNGLHARWLTAEVLEAMREAGFATLRLGYESGLGRHRNDTASKAGRGELAAAVRRVLAAGFTPESFGVYVMGGLPLQGPGDMLDEMRFAASLGAQVKPVFVSPVPRTPLFAHYASRFPELASDPLLHNDTYFVTKLDGWGWDEVEGVRERARSLNASVCAPDRRPEAFAGARPVGR
jgi:hypothetical protein